MATIISKLKAVLTLDNKKFEKGLKDSEKKTKSFGTTMGKLGGIIGGAFALKEIAKFGIEMSKLGVKMDVVGNKFSEFADGDYLKDLQKSTGGMISDLELMQLSIKSVNLGLNQADLAGYFRFATIRAAETGESVDYLVNSIVNGIGRQSKLILDNLGISAKRLADQIKLSGDFSTAAGILIREEMSKTNTKIEDVIIGVDLLSTSWSNFSNNLSKESGPLNDFFIRLSEFVKTLDRLINFDAKLEASRGIKSLFRDVLQKDASNVFVTEMNKINDSITTYQEKIKELEKEKGTLDPTPEDVSFFDFGEKLKLGKKAFEKPFIIQGQITFFEQQLETLIEKRKELKKLNESPASWDEFLSTMDKVEVSVEKPLKTIGDLKEEIKDILSYIDETEVTDIESITTFNLQLEDLRDQLKYLQSIPIVDVKVKFKIEKFEDIDISPDIDTGEVEPFIPALAGSIDQLTQMVNLFTDLQNAAVVGSSAFDSFGKELEKWAERLDIAIEKTKDFKEESTQLGAALLQLAGQGIVAVSSALGELIGGDDTEDVLKNFISGIANLLKGFGALLISFGVAKESLKSLSGPVMIAAGAALVVIGSAISTSLGNISSAAGGTSSSGGGSTSTFGPAAYDYNREIVLVARGDDLVATLKSAQNKQAGIGGI